MVGIGYFENRLNSNRRRFDALHPVPCKGYGWTLCPRDMTLHRHVLKRIRELDATAATHPVRSALNREDPAKVAVMTSKRKVVALPQQCCYPFHKSSLGYLPTNVPTALRIPKLRAETWSKRHS